MTSERSKRRDFLSLIFIAKSISKKLLIKILTVNEKTQPPPWKAIWDWVRVWKHLPWIFHLVGMFFSLVSIIIQFLFLFSCPSCDFHQNNGKKGNWYFFSTGNPPWYSIIAISLSWLVLVIGFNNNSINTVSFSTYFPFYVIFIKKWQKKGIAIFSTGHPSWKVDEKLQRAFAANPEEVAVGTDPNIE